MKKLVIYIFLLSFLLQNTFFGEVIKLPILIQHFIEHKEEDTQISFAEFITMHYLNGDIKDADYDRDMQLPFKKITSTVSSIPYYFQENNIPEIEIPFSILENKTYPILENKIAYNTLLEAIWQPPKKA